MSWSVQISCMDANRFPHLSEAADLACALFGNDVFSSQIACQAGFALSNIAPVIIAGLMREADLKMAVKTYYALSPVKNLDGYDDPEHPFVINLNAWQLSRPAASICNSIVHGFVHAVNAIYSQFSFGHACTNLPGKEHTAPYRIGAIAQRLVSGAESVVISLDHDETETRIKSIRRRFDSEFSVHA